MGTLTSTRNMSTMSVRIIVFIFASTFTISVTNGLFLDNKASWSKAVSSYFDAPVERNGLSSIMLDPVADWQTALEKILSQQSLYNNIVKELFNSFTRIVGWSLISVVVYGFIINKESQAMRENRSDDHQLDHYHYLDNYVK